MHDLTLPKTSEICLLSFLLYNIYKLDHLALKTRLYFKFMNKQDKCKVIGCM